MTLIQKIIHGGVAILFTLLVSGLFFVSQTVNAQNEMESQNTVFTEPANNEMETQNTTYTGGAGAVNQGNTGGEVNQGNTGGQVNQGNTGGGSGGTGKLTNPLQSQTIPEFLLKIIDVLLVFAMPIIILYIMYAGFLFVTAAGNTEQISTAKNALLWSVVGGVIVLGARVIISVIEGTIKAF